MFLTFRIFAALAAADDFWLELPLFAAVETEDADEAVFDEAFTVPDFPFPEEHPKAGDKITVQASRTVARRMLLRRNFFKPVICKINFIRLS